MFFRFSIIGQEEESQTHSLSSDLGTLINHEKSSDLILQAGDRQFQVHRNILAARSPVFAKLLSQLEENDENPLNTSETSALIEDETNDNVDNKAARSKGIGKEIRREIYPKASSKEKDRSMKKLLITDLPANTVEELLRYIYTDNCNNMDQLSRTLLAASDQYQLPGLKLNCEKHLGENISPLNVAEILLISDKYKSEVLKKTALAYLGENHPFIMKVGLKGGHP